jgi:ABC-type lipoprotein export system ATPase subunit
MLELRNIEIIFDDTVILNKTSISIPQHKVTLIKGVSGSGKTSLLYRIGLISEDNSFEYNIYDKEDNIDVIRKQYISFVLQENSLFEQYDVLGNMKLYASFNDKKYSEEDYRNILKSVNLDISLHQSIQTLSGGQKQRVAIACALCKDTEIMILDEPTSFLDKENEILIFDILKKLSVELGKTIIIASHSDSAINIADEIYEIKEKMINEVKHCTEIENSIGKVNHHHLSISFYSYYVKYFFKKYKKFEASIIGIVSIAILLMNVLNIYTNYSINKSIDSYQSLSENQLFITQNKDNITIDTSLNCFSYQFDNDIKVYPFIKTQIDINGMIYTVVPIYKENNLSDQILLTYNSNKIYMSYYCYREITSNLSNSEDLNCHFIINDSLGNIYEENTLFKIGGVLKKNNECPYFKGENKYIYCDYSVLEKLYEKYNLDHLESYVGYTLFTDSYDDYISVYNRLKNKDIGVNLFFNHISEMEELSKISIIIKILIICVVFILTMIFIYIIEMLYFRKRDNEYMMLKMNGVNNRQLAFMSLAEVIIQIFIAFILNNFVIIILSAFNIIPISIIYIFSIIILTTYMQYMHICKINVENILRN